MLNLALLFSLSLAATTLGQQVGNYTSESHPKLTWQTCTGGGSCSSNSGGSVTIDSNWRWTHITGNYTNCYTGNTWNTSICTDGATCASKCAVEGANYASTYGISTSGNALTLKFVTKGENTNIGSRVYLMASDTKYQMFNVLNKEFTFDVDVSQLPCGLNGALYFVQMDEDGGMAKNSGNKAGAKYGTGYCDSQCPRDIKYINGEANVQGWNPSPNDTNAGQGQYGACCAEMDIWEANSISAAYTPHPCKTTNEGGLQRCTGQECNTPDRYGGLCDPDGCDFNSYRMGDRTYYGKGLTVDTSKKFTVVTQFITDNNSTTGTLIEIRRLYVQDGKVIPNSKTNFPGLLDAFDSVTPKFCDDGKKAFGDHPSFQNQGGLAQMGRSLGKGHVLVLSIWDDHTANMLWLDSSYPTDADANKPGIARGTCATDSGKPPDVESNNGNSQVIFSNIKFGDIGSTYSGTPITLPQAPLPPGYNPPTGGNPTTTTTATTTTTQGPTPTIPNTPGATQTKYGQW
ncbi:cellobiohydrolase I-II [Ephemerocybe angulata]|uniref:Glucanase n=1 Tax=Ephemerocybe angulata TaxID=980116 RepID=A0A8H6M9N9_9AGAR|nr:cellobiohydrolase I-II [Tulosesus angulatus]